MNWQDILTTHASAADRLAETAGRIPNERWLMPAQEGKWSPGHVLEHLNLVYDTLDRELAGGQGMALLTKWWQRVVLRWTMVPRILRGGWFPAGARAPREIRPAQPAADQTAAIAAFRERSQRFHEKVQAAQAAGGSQMTHAYFGKAPLPESLLLCSRHIEHHQRLLEQLTR
jgi:hypothetical protein